MKKQNKYIDYYYYVSVFINMLLLFVPQIHVGILCALYIFIVYGKYLLKYLGKKRKIRISRIEIIVIIYAVWCINSIILGTLNNYGVMIGISQFSNSILPVVFFFFSERNLGNTDKFIQVFVKSVLIISLVGLFFYFTNNSLYIRYMQNTIQNFYIESYVALPRMNSFVGSVIVGTFCPMAYVYILFGENKKTIMKYVFLCILSLSTLLSMQRAAWATWLIVTILYFVINLLNRNSKVIIKGIILLIVLSFVIYANIFGIANKISGLFNLRNFSVSSALNERNGSWSKVFEFGVWTLIGHGLGTGGHRVLGTQNFQILDGYYFEGIYEVGLIGMGLLMVIIIYCFYKGIKNNRYSELCMLGIILITALGSSVISFQLVSPIFWYILGIMSNKKRRGKYESSGDVFTTVS